MADIDVKLLLTARKGKVDFIKIPKLLIAVVEGVGDPEGPEFAEAIAALYSVSYTAKFAVKKAGAEPPKVMPLEAEWWVEGTDLASWATVPRNQWHWRAYLVQLPPITIALLKAAAKAAAARPDASSALSQLKFEYFAEGLVAQTLHIGPYAGERATIDFLHAEIARAGYQPRGHHHEIYLGDPRRSAPEKLRTILRQPVAR